MRNEYDGIGRSRGDIRGMFSQGSEGRSAAKRGDVNEWTTNSKLNDVLDVIEDLNARLNEVRRCIGSAKTESHSSWNQCHKEMPDWNHREARPRGVLTCHQGHIIKR